MAKGSHATRGGWEPKTCCVCGQPVRVTKDTAWFHFDHRTGGRFSVHMACRLHSNSVDIWEVIRCSPPSAT